MQTPKSRPGSLEVTQRPMASTPRTACKLRTPGSDSDASSPNPIIKTPKERSTKVVDRRSPRTPVTEKKRPSRVSELESQLAQLQEELKKAKDQLTSSESSKKRAQHEAEEAKKQLAAMSVKLESTQKQLNDLSDSEESRFQELRKISQDRDRSWQSELDALQKQHSMDSTALVSAMNEIQRLKIQLERVSESEASRARHAESAHGEIQSLRMELTETLGLVEKLKNQLNDCRESESQAIEGVSRAQMELEVVKGNEGNAIESFKSLLVELEQSKNQVSDLEELVSNLQYDLANARNSSDDDIKPEETELNDLKNETNQLRASLEAAERRNGEEYLKSTSEIRHAYKLVELAKSESCQLSAELEAKVKESEAEAEELRMKLIENEEVNQNEIEIELNKSAAILEELKASLLYKETLLQQITEENEKLKSEIEKYETESSKAGDEALALADEARPAEREALMKPGFVTEEADKSCRKAARVTEQLDAAQAANSEMEAELRRLKVQSDQWRKAAEEATAMLSTTGSNGKHVERTGSFDYHAVDGKLDLAYNEDIMDEESPKKKSGNVLRKIGVLLKKK